MAGTIEGTITDGSGNPLVDALVVVTESGSIVEQARTDVVGQYAVNVADGTYDVIAEKVGYLDGTFTDVSVSGDTQIANLALSPGYRLRGRNEGRSVETVGDRSLTSNAGVLGEAAATSGGGYGVAGLTPMRTAGAAGTFGKATAADERVHGVYGVTRGQGVVLGGRLPAAGVYGTAGNDSGATAGVYGVNTAAFDDDAAVEGLASATTGKVYGIRGQSLSKQAGAAGVYGEGAPAGETYGLKGRTQSGGAGGAGVYGEAPNTHGIRGVTDSGGIGDAGVYGESTTGQAFGVKGEAVAAPGSGLYGTASDPDAYGLWTPDTARIDGDIEAASGHTLTVGGDRILRTGGTGTDTNGSGVTYTIGGSIVGGYEGNSANGVLGATIAGGGGERTDTEKDILLVAPNEVTDRFGTVSGGSANRAGDAQSGTTNAKWATVGGGLDNTARGEAATVGGGYNNTASTEGSTVGGGSQNAARGIVSTVGGGDENTASRNSATVCGGAQNTANGTASTVGGGFQNRTGKSGTSKGRFATVPGGRDNVAQGDYSFAAGRKAKATNGGSFVWGDGTSTSISSTGANQFVVQASNGAGFGTDDPICQLHVVQNVTGTGPNLTKHAAGIQNTATGTADVLGLQLPNIDQPDSTNNFITFLDDDAMVGSIQGDAGGGVTFNSATADYAEYLPRLDPDEPIEPADVVGVVDGAITRRTGEADQVMVVSDRPIVSGNSPGGSTADREDHETVAFVGQVPVRVRGPVETGDLIVPSGDHDGTGRAVAPGKWRPDDGPIVGQAWEASEDQEVSEVLVAVGIDDPATVAPDRERIADLEADNEALRADLERKDERIDTQRERIDDLKSTVEQKDHRIATLEDRLAAVETHLDLADTPRTPADD